MTEKSQEPAAAAGGQALILKGFLVVALICAVLAANSSLNFVAWPSRIDLRFVALAAGAQGLFWLVATAAWRQVVRTGTGQDLPFRTAFAHTALLMVGKYIPGKVWGMLARGHQLTQRGLAVSQTVRATYLEQISATHAGCIVGMCSVLFAAGSWWASPVLVLCLLSAWTLPRYHDGLLHLFAGWLTKRFSTSLDTLSLATLGSRDYARLVLIFTAEWLTLGALSVCLYLALVSQPPPAGVMLLIIGAYALGMIVGFFAFFAPGGVGVREAVIVGILANQMPLPEATLLAVALRVWSVAADICVAGIAVLMRAQRGSAH